MFTTKQSDVFFNDQTKEMFVCKVSSISGQRCEGPDVVYGALPIVYKIDKDTNYQSIIYPKNIDTFKDDIKSDLFDLLPANYYGDNTDFSYITKPLINYNKTSDRYSVTCMGRYSATSDGFGILSYIFQYIDTNFYLLDARSYIPKGKAESNIFTFKNGYLNSDFIIGGNKLRWNEPVDTAYAERVTDYNIKPTHLDSNDSLGFNLMAYCPDGDSGAHCLTGTNQYPLLWSGGYITYNPKYAAFDPNYDIRVDIRAKSFNVPAMTAYRSKQSSNSDANPSRWVDKAVTTSATGGLSGAGSGFSVFFYRNPLVGIVEPQGIGSTLGYAKASSVVSEVAGETTSVNGLVINDPTISQQYHSKLHPHSHDTDYVKHNYGPPANSFLGIGFDIKGDFCTTSEGKEGWLSAGGGAGTWSHGHAGGFTNTTAPCSVAIRSNRDTFTRVLTCISMSTVAASAVPMHEESANNTGSDIDFQDYRIDLTNKGTRVTIYNKLTSATDYNTILQFDLNSVKNEKGIYYNPWSGYYNQKFSPPGTAIRGAVSPYYHSGDRTPVSKDPRFQAEAIRQPTPRRIGKMGPTDPFQNPGPGFGQGIGIGSSAVSDPIIFDDDVDIEVWQPEDTETVWELPIIVKPERHQLINIDYGPRPGMIIEIQPEPEPERHQRIYIDYPPRPGLTKEISDFTYTPPPLVPPVIIDDEDDIKKYPGGRSPSQGLIAPLNVGLSFTTSEYTSHFELLSFKVTGVRMGKPTQLLQKTDNTTTVEYLEQSSANLRRELVTIPTTDPVDITMSIKRSSLIDRINLCGELPQFVDEELEAKWTGVTKIRNDIPGPPKEITEIKRTITPSEACAGWFEPGGPAADSNANTNPLAVETEGDTAGNRGGSVSSGIIGGWHRISESQLQSNRFEDTIEETDDRGRMYKVRYQSPSGTVGLQTDLTTQLGYYQPGDPMLTDAYKKKVQIGGHFLPSTIWKQQSAPSPGTIGSARGGVGWTWVVEAVWFTDEEAKSIGACEEEGDYVDPDTGQLEPHPGPLIQGAMLFRADAVGDWIGAENPITETQSDFVTIGNPTDVTMYITLMESGSMGYEGTWTVTGQENWSGMKSQAVTLPPHTGITATLIFTDTRNSIAGLQEGNYPKVQWSVGEPYNEASIAEIPCTVTGTRPGGGTEFGGTGTECPPVATWVLQSVKDRWGTSKQIYTDGFGNIALENGWVLDSQCSQVGSAHDYFDDVGGSATRIPGIDDQGAGSGTGIDFGDLSDPTDPCNDQFSTPGELPIGGCPAGSYWGQRGFGGG